MKWFELKKSHKKCDLYLSERGILKVSFVSNGHLHPVQLDLAADRTGVRMEASRLQLEVRRHVAFRFRGELQFHSPLQNHVFHTNYRTRKTSIVENNFYRTDQMK